MSLIPSPNYNIRDAILIYRALTIILILTSSLPKPPPTANPSHGSPIQAGSVDREAQLAKVFVAFDLDGSGALEPEELLVLGIERIDKP